MKLGKSPLQCPGCAGNNVDPSHWRSRDEKARHPGSRPVRCRDCGHRFHVGADADQTAIGGMALAGIVALGVVVLGAAVAFWPRSEVVADVPAPALSATITPAVTAAAEGGDPEAQYAVATSLLSDAELNLAYSAKAIGLLTQAADKGHARAMLRLGQIYRKGIDAPQNFALAAKWIEMSARLGEAQAMLELGRLHREGIGMPMDLVKAYIWLNRAAAARDLDAPRERAEVARHLTAAELKQAQDESTHGHLVAASAGSAQSPAATGPATTAARP